MSLFKYMSAEVAPLFANSLKVRFTQPSELNDPFEFRPLIDFEGTAAHFAADAEAKITARFGTTESALAMIEEQQRTDPNFPKVPIDLFRRLLVLRPELAHEFLAELERHKAEVLGPIRKTEIWRLQWEKFQDVLGRLGIFSLTEDPIHNVMWGHYASQHRGIVVEFDDQNLWFHQKLGPNDEFRHLVKVSYVENPHPRSLSQLAGGDVLYTKNMEWSYEREWRIIRPLKDGIEVSAGKFFFEVPPEAISAVIFGARTNPVLATEIRSAMERNPSMRHARLNRAKLLEGGKIEIVGADKLAAAGANP